MEPGKHSRTAIVTAAMRAAHMILDKPPYILEDSYALAFAGFKSEDELTNLFSNQEQIGFSENRAYFVTRHRYVEDELFKSLTNNEKKSQYIILGSGLDSFAYRHKIDELKIQVFEVDHPDSLAWKHECVSNLKTCVSKNVKYVPLDFTQNSVVSALRENGMLFDQPVFISWLGVTLYLTEDSVYSTLSELSENLPSGSIIVFDYVLNGEFYNEKDKEIVNNLSQRSASVGESWKSSFNPDELKNKLQGIGFTKCFHFPMSEAMDQYFKGRCDGLVLPGYPQLIKVVK